MHIGSYDIELLSDGVYRLDGGSMFGIVPRVLWERQHPPDERNRVELALQCLLVRGEDRVLLVDNGMGQGWKKRQLEIYGLERPEGDIVAALARHGIAPTDVTDMVLTHLHFDHAGGTIHHEEGEDRLRFPNATHWLQKSHLRWGREPTPRDRASFRPEDWELLVRQEGRLRLLEGPGEFLPGIRAHIVNGHSPGQQLIQVGEGEGALLFCADLVPFASHLRTAWVMAYDLNPLITISEKTEMLARAATLGWTLVYQHDAAVPASTIEATDGGFQIKDKVML